LSTSVDEATLDAALRLADLAPPGRCRAGLLANLALLAHHGRSCGGWMIRTDPAD
jgi:hypothetical protein